MSSKITQTFEAIDRWIPDPVQKWVGKTLLGVLWVWTVFTVQTVRDFHDTWNKRAEQIEENSQMLQGLTDLPSAVEDLTRSVEKWAKAYISIDRGRRTAQGAKAIVVDSNGEAYVHVNWRDSVASLYSEGDRVRITTMDGTGISAVFEVRGSFESPQDASLLLSRIVGSRLGARPGETLRVRFEPVLP